MAPSAPAPWPWRTRRRTGSHSGAGEDRRGAAPPRRPGWPWASFRHAHRASARSQASRTMASVSICPPPPASGAPAAPLPGVAPGVRGRRPHLSRWTTQWEQATVRCVRSATRHTRPHNPGEHPTRGSAHPTSPAAMGQFCATEAVSGYPCLARQPKRLSRLMTSVITGGTSCSHDTSPTAILSSTSRERMRSRLTLTLARPRRKRFSVR